jgi:uncharacterized protein (TIGR02757 family)
MDLKKRLDYEVLLRDEISELSEDRPDPMLVAREYRDEVISLVCALFAYGNAKQIVKFLRSLDFTLLDSSEDKIRDALKNHYYRFQNPTDVAEFFITLKRAKELGTLESLFLKGYKESRSILDGLASLISRLRELNDYTSQGYNFLLGTPPTSKSKSTYKRYNMYLRWMVRSDSIDLGLWSGVKRSDLLMPLDTHTFKVSQRLGLLKRKSYDLKAVIELTNALKEFDIDDPIKYDFALYRIGQEGLDLL